MVSITYVLTRRPTKLENNMLCYERPRKFTTRALQNTTKIDMSPATRLPSISRRQFIATRLYYSEPFSAPRLFNCCLTQIHADVAFLYKKRFKKNFVNVDTYK